MKYKEILKLADFCNENGIEYQTHNFLGGTALRFNNGGDVVQNIGSYGSSSGAVEFGYTGFQEVDFKATTLEKAKEFILAHKDELNKKGA